MLSPSPQHLSAGTCLHRAPAGAKLTCAMALVLAIALLPPRAYTALAIAGGGLLVLSILARLSARLVLRRLLLLEPVVLMASGLALFQPDGWRLFIGIAIKSTLCLLTMILLSWTTPFGQIIGVLRRLRLPPLLLTTLALLERYLFVLVDESQRMRRARLSRTFSTGRWRQWKATGLLVGRLFVRASERADRVYAAMCARGWR